MAALALEENIANGKVQREHVFRDQTDQLAQDDEWLLISTVLLIFIYILR